MFDKRMLQKAYDWCSDNACDWGDEHMRVAAMCVKKQIPRWIKNLKTDAYGITSGNCPECGCEVFQENDTYCPDCGQALKWTND